MKPVIHIEIDGLASAQVMDRLLSVTVTDETGNSADTLEMTFDDRPPALALPAKGVEISVALGWAEAVPLGIFHVDQIGASGPPATMRVTGKAVSMRQQMKAPKTRSWDRQTLGALVRTIAQEHGFDASVTPSLAVELIPHLSQIAESDMALLTRLASERGAAAKPKGGKLLFYPLGRQAQALNAGPVQLSSGDFTSWDWDSDDRPSYASCTAWWRDHAAGQRVSLTIGEGEPGIELTDTYSTREKAQAAAEARIAASKRKTGNLEGKLARGNPRIRAEGRIRVAGLRTGPDGLWTPKRVTHQATARGYLTQFTAERALEA